MPREQYQRINDYVMGFIYSPLLIIVAWFEKSEAHRITANRRRGEADDDVVEEWEEAAEGVDYDSEEWEQKVAETTPNVLVDTSVLEIRELKSQIAVLTEQVKLLLEAKANVTAATGESSGETADETN